MLVDQFCSFHLRCIQQSMCDIFWNLRSPLPNECIQIMQFPAIFAVAVVAASTKRGWSPRRAWPRPPTTMTPPPLMTSSTEMSKTTMPKAAKVMTVLQDPDLESIEGLFVHTYEKEKISVTL